MCVTKRRWFLTLGLRFTLFLHTRFRLCCSSSKMCTCSVSLRSEPESSEPLSNKSYSGNRQNAQKKIIHIIIVPKCREPCQCLFRSTYAYIVHHIISVACPQVLIIFIQKEGGSPHNTQCHAVGNNIILYTPGTMISSHAHVPGPTFVLQ